MRLQSNTRKNDWCWVSGREYATWEPTWQKQTTLGIRWSMFDEVDTVTLEEGKSDAGDKSRTSADRGLDFFEA